MVITKGLRVFFFVSGWVVFFSENIRPFLTTFIFFSGYTQTLSNNINVISDLPGVTNSVMFLKKSIMQTLKKQMIRWYKMISETVVPNFVS